MESVEETLQTILDASPKAISSDSQFSSHHQKLKSMAISAQRPDLLGSDREEKALIHQWINFTLNHLASSAASSASPTPEARALVDELNARLSSRAFVAGGDRLSLADLVLFAATRAHFAAISFQEKERLVNASRWFAHVQERVREDRSQRGFGIGKELPNIVFVRNRLYHLAL